MQREVVEELIHDIRTWINEYKYGHVVYTKYDTTCDVGEGKNMSIFSKDVMNPEKLLDDLLTLRFDLLEIRFYKYAKSVHSSFILFFKNYELTGICFCTNHFDANDAKINIINNKIIYSNILSQPFELKNINEVKDLYECVRKKHIDEYINFHSKINSNAEFDFSHTCNYFKSLPYLHVLQHRLDTLDSFENNIIEIEI